MKFNFLIAILLAVLPGFLVASQAQVAWVSPGYFLALAGDADYKLACVGIRCAKSFETRVSKSSDPYPGYDFVVKSQRQSSSSVNINIAYYPHAETRSGILPLDQHFPQERQREFIERIGDQVGFTEKAEQDPIELTWQDTDTLYSIPNSWPLYPQTNLKNRVNFRYPKTWFISWGKNHPYIVASIFTLVFGGLIAYKKWSMVKKLLTR